jgi:hypothetical protein
VIESKKASDGVESLNSRSSTQNSKGREHNYEKPFPQAYSLAVAPARPIQQPLTEVEMAGLRHYCSLHDKNPFLPPLMLGNRVLRLPQSTIDGQIAAQRASYLNDQVHCKLRLAHMNLARENNRRKKEALEDKLEQVAFELQKLEIMQSRKAEQTSTPPMQLALARSSEPNSTPIEPCPIHIQIAFSQRLQYLRDEALNLLRHIERRPSSYELALISKSLQLVRFKLVRYLPVAKLPNLRRVAGDLHRHAEELAQLWRKTLAMDLTQAMTSHAYDIRCRNIVPHPHDAHNPGLPSKVCVCGVKSEVMRCVNKMRKERVQSVFITSNDSPVVSIPPGYRGDTADITTFLSVSSMFKVAGFVWTAAGPGYVWKGPLSDIFAEEKPVQTS